MSVKANVQHSIVFYNVLNVKVLVSAFNQEKALVGVFSVIGLWYLREVSLRAPLTIKIFCSPLWGNVATCVNWAGWSMGGSGLRAVIMHHGHHIFIASPHWHWPCCAHIDAVITFLSLIQTSNPALSSYSFSYCQHSGFKLSSYGFV